jgi:hypothetical protein
MDRWQRKLGVNPFLGDIDPAHHFELGKTQKQIVSKRLRVGDGVITIERDGGVGTLIGIHSPFQLFPVHNVSQ